MTRLFLKQLLIAILPVVVLAALSTLWITSVAEQQMLAQLKDELAVESQLHAEGVRSFLDQRTAELRAIAAAPVSKQGDLQTILPYLADERARLSGFVEGIYFNDLEGNVHSDSGKHFNVRDRAYYPQLQRGALIITRLPKSRDTNHEIVLVMVPLYDQQRKHIGAIAGGVRIDLLLQQVDDILPESKGFAVLVDSDNTLMSQRQPAQRQGPLATWVAKAHDGSAEANLGGTDYLLHYRSVPNSPWKFALAKRRSLVTEKVVRVRYTNLAVVSLVLVLATIIAFISTRRLLSPVTKLLAVCQRFGEGDWDARATNLPHDELGELGQAFNNTADQVTQRYASELAAEQEARASESRFRLLLNSIADAVYLHDTDGNFLDANNSACTSLGYTREELLQLNIADIVSDIPVQRLRQLWDDIKAGGQGYRREGSHRRKNGGVFPVEVNAVPLQTADGVQILASARDISERKRAEEKIAKFFRLSDDMMCIADTQGKFRQLSPAFEQVLGWKREDLLNTPYIDLVHPDDRQMTLEEGGRVIRGEAAVNFENRYRCKDGSYRWLQWRPFREVDEGMIYAIARDVTESHRNTRLLLETNAAAHVGGWEFDFITNALFWTAETYRLHDTSPDEYRPNIDASIAFFTPDSREAISAAIAKAKIDGTPWNLELEFITAKGRTVWAHAIGRVDIDNGHPVRAYGSFQDITERRKAEAERRLIDDKLREMQRVESIGILAGGIAHDFNNLLTGILGFTRLSIAEAADHETLSSHLQQIENCALRAADLCKQLLAYAGKGKFVIECISLSDLVRDTAQLVETIFGSQAQLEFDLAENLPWIEGDATQMRQIVMNLTTNAYDSLNESPGVVHVRTGVCHVDEAWLQTAAVRGDIAAGPAVFLEVQDTGCGMDDETRAHIFDPFFTTKFAGRGLGLAAVLGIVRSHHGALAVTTEPGQGSTFRVVFPPAEDAEIPAEYLPTDSEDGDAEVGGQVLVIDDEASVRTLASSALERVGYEVLAAEHGPQAIEIFTTSAHHIVAVLIDMTMPGMNGLEVARRLRELNPHVPLLMMSGYSDLSLDNKADLPLSGFVPKPFKLVDLQDAVKKAIQTAKNQHRSKT